MAKRNNGIDTPVGRVTNNLGGNGGRGGGPGSRVNREVSVKTGQPRAGKNPAAVAQIGAAVDPKARELMPAKAYNSGVGLGNEVALNSKTAPGQGRTNYGKSGMNHTHGPVNPGGGKAQGSDILSKFGPERSGGKS